MTSTPNLPVQIHYMLVTAGVSTVEAIGILETVKFILLTDTLKSTTKDTE